MGVVGLKRAEPELLVGVEPELVWPHGGHRPRSSAPQMAIGGSQLGLS